MYNWTSKKNMMRGNMHFTYAILNWYFQSRWTGFSAYIVFNDSNGAWIDAAES